MKFSSRIILFAFMSAALFIVSLAVTIVSLFNIRSNFDSYINNEQQVERGISEMYAQGLQMGQALRNIVLDPKNPKAYENLKSSQAAYDKAYEQTLKAGENSPLKDAIHSLASLRAAQASAQEHVLPLIANTEQAIKVLNSEETPAWRNLRAELLRLRELSGNNEQTVHESVSGNAKSSITISIVMCVIAIVVALVLNLLMLRALNKDLGCEPSDARAALESIAHGNLAFHIKSTGNSGSLMDAMHRMQTSLRNLVSSVRHGSESVAMASAEIARGNMDLSQRTEVEAGALQHTTASMGNLGERVKQNADGASKANQLAMKSSEAVRRSQEVVGEVVETMKGINEASHKISAIISVIDGIAFQTNILALNAAVEAARAGEQGRGFAVVAGEVRALAGRSAEAAKEIKGLINASVQKIEQGYSLVNHAGNTMAEVVMSFSGLTEITNQISGSSSEQSHSVAEVIEEITKMEQSTQQNAALVEEMAAAASGLKSQAQDLVELVSQFKLEQNAMTLRG